MVTVFVGIFMGISFLVLWICGNYLKTLWEKQANKAATPAAMMLVLMKAIFAALQILNLLLK